MTESQVGLAIDWEALEALCAQRGWEDDPTRARGLRISYQTLNNLRNHRVGVGAKVIDRVLREFGGAVYPKVFKAETKAAA